MVSYNIRVQRAQSVPRDVYDVKGTRVVLKAVRQTLLFIFLFTFFIVAFTLCIADII